MVTKKPKKEKKFRIQFKYAILTYGCDDQLSDDLIQNVIEKNFYSIGSKCNNDEEINHKHFHYFIYPKNTEKADIKDERYFDVPIENTMVGFYVPYTGESGKEELKLICHENYNNNIDYDIYSKEKYNTNIYKILNSIHPNLKVIQKRNSQYNMLNYIFNKNECLEIYNHTTFKDVEDIMNHFKNSSKEKNLSKTELKILELKTFVMNQLTENISLDELINRINSDDRISGIYYGKYLQNKQMVKDIYLKKINADINIKYPTDDIKIYKYYNDIFLLPKTLFDYVEFINNHIKEWYSGFQNRDRHTSLILTGGSKIFKSTLIRLLGPCNECNNRLDQQHLSPNAPFNLFNDIDPDKEKDQKYIPFKNFKGFFGSQSDVGIRCAYEKEAVIKNGIPLIWTNNHPIQEIVHPSYMAYIIRNCTIIQLDQDENPEKNVNFFLPNKNNYKYFGKTNKILINNYEINGPIKNWIYFDPKSTYWYQEKVNKKYCYNIINTGCYEFSYTCKKPINPLHGTKWIPNEPVLTLVNGRLESSNGKHQISEKNTLPPKRTKFY